MAENLEQELNPSELGTKDYWEKIYSEEINNFEDHGDVGEVWFGKNNALKVVKCIAEDLSLSKSDRIIDIGCGNAWTLVQLAKKGFTSLVGTDYAPTAIDLAKAILKENDIVESQVELIVSDILDRTDGIFTQKFKLAHDKGTYDAISLNPDNSLEKRMEYVANVPEILRDDGYLVLSSCNWTKEELEQHFKGHFDIVRTIEAPAMKFGGKVGQSVTNIVFKKKIKSQ